MVSARGGTEIALGIYYFFFSSIEFICVVCQSGPYVRALYEAIIIIYIDTENVPHILYCIFLTQPILYFIFVLHFNSSHLIFFHLISYLLIYQLTSFFSFHLNIVYFFISPKLVLIYLGSSTRQSPISYYEVYIKYFPLFYIIKFIQHISLYYFVLQNLNKIFPRPILNSKACTQAFSNIILYCNAYTKYIPILF
jgi:hypothetical protein